MGTPTMKKLLLGLGIVSVLALLLWPGTASAQAIVDVIPKNPENITRGDLLNVLSELIKWGLMFAAGIGVIFIVINGYQYILSAGNQEQVEKAKMGLTWSVGGLILVISAYAIVLLLSQVLGFSSIDQLRARQPVGTPGSTASVLENISNIIFVLGGATAVLFMIIGGYRYVTSQGNPELIDKAKKTLLYAVIGLVLVMISGTLFNLIAQTVGSPDRIT